MKVARSKQSSVVGLFRWRSGNFVHSLPFQRATHKANLDLDLHTIRIGQGDLRILVLAQFLGKDQPLIVLGTVQQGERGAKIIAEDIFLLDKAVEQFTEQTAIRLPADRIGRNQLTELKEMIYRFHGSAPIKLTLHFDGRGEVDILPMQDITVRPCPDFFQQVKESFGPGCLSVQMRPTEVRRKKRYGGGKGR